MPPHPAPSALAGRNPPDLRPGCSAARRSLARAAQRLALRLYIALALALSQGAALTHVITHTAEVSAARSGQGVRFDSDDGVRHLAYCVDCLAFSGIDLPLANGVCTPAATAAALPPATFRSACIPVGDGLAPRCRAPPVATA